MNLLSCASRWPVRGSHAVAWASCGLALPLLGLAAHTAALAQPTASAPPDDTLPTLSVTGTALRRIDAETALPVTVIRRTEIERSGARSVAELLQALPAMQGFVPGTAVTGNDTRGYTSVSLHDLGDGRTLVLLNGLRVAPFGGQTPNGAYTGVDINTLPLAMVERIEVLSDGASALYGADALGGVVNVITRSDGDANEATAGWRQARGGARTWSVSAYKGVGDLQADGQVLSLGASAWRRSALPATARSYARNAQVDFMLNGQKVRVIDDIDAMARSAPANAYDQSGAGGNPALATTGQCPAGQYDYFGTYCLYNYAADVMLVPAQAQHSAMASFTRRVGDDGHWTLDALWSRSTVWSQLAPIGTTQDAPLQIPASSPLYGPYLDGLGITGDPASADARFVDLGPRRQRDLSSLLDVAARADGRLHGWAWQAALKQSSSHQRSDIAGAISQGGVQSLIGTGYNPFVGAGQQSAAGLAALQQRAYSGNWTQGDFSLQGLQLQASRPVMDLPAGPLRLALGADLRQERWRFSPSDFAQGLVSDVATGATGPYADSQLRQGDAFALQPVAASRRTWGLFSEWLMPLQANPDHPAKPRWELGAALRADHDDRVGEALTAKLHTRWQATPTLMWRASVGTGFKAPSLGQLHSPTQSQGVTSAHACTAALQALAQSLGATPCDPSSNDGQVSYDAVATGNRDLKAERSQQASVGLRLEPLVGHSIGLDWWVQRVADQIGDVNESVAFDQPQATPYAWTTVATANGTQLALLQQPRNAANTIVSGIDLDASVRRGSRIGLVETQLRLSTLLREDSRLYPGGPWTSNIGDGLYGAPSLRWRAQWRTSISRAGLTHSLTARYQSGYTDAPVTLQVLDASNQPTGDTLQWRAKVPASLRWDWLTQWQLDGHWQLSLGIDNVFNRRPPMTLDTTGTYKAYVVGYDERFFDPLGRVWAVQARLSF
jgi:iron complex outermembrane receptor protein